MSDENERSVASDGSATSAFGDWFDAQFPPEPGVLAGKTTDELLDMVIAGSRAQDELGRRQDRRNMERAALSAWMARNAMSDQLIGCHSQPRQQTPSSQRTRRINSREQRRRHT